MIAKLSLILLVCLGYSIPVMAVPGSIKPRTGIMSKLKRSYGEVSFGGGYKGGIFGLGGGIIGNKRGLGVNFFGTINFWRSPNRPSDFEPYSGMFFHGAEYPKNIAASAAITLAKDFATNNERLIWVIAAGPCFTNIETKTFERQQSESGYFFSESNYSIGRPNVNTMGVVFKGSVAYMSRKKFANQLSVLVNVNGKHTYAGIQFDMLWGKLWNHPKRPKKPKRIPTPRVVPNT